MWGRDELQTGGMWNSNSVIAWQSCAAESTPARVRSGVRVPCITVPAVTEVWCPHALQTQRCRPVSAPTTRPTTPSTAKALRPPRSEQVLTTRLLGREALLELQDRQRVRRPHHPAKLGNQPDGADRITQQPTNHARAPLDGRRRVRARVLHADVVADVVRARDVGAVGRILRRYDWQVGVPAAAVVAAGWPTC